MNKIIILTFFMVLNLINIVYAQFDSVKRGYAFSFPKDHGAHNNYPAEWWYFTGHLKDKDKTFGFELTFFRIGVKKDSKKSVYDSNNLLLAHFAITDDQEKKFYYSSKFERELLGRNFAKTDTLDVKLDNWSVKLINNSIILNASALKNNKNFSLNLKLKPNKPLVLHGLNGFSKKGSEIEEASYYMSFTDLKGVGELKISNKVYNVSASSWMDHEVISFKANDTSKSWDWFGVKLDNGEELMFFNLRENKKLSQFSSGSYVLKNGELINLKKDDFIVTYLDYWKSSKTNTKYPTEFNVSIPKFGINLNIKASVKNQELFNTNTRSYWEGRCLVNGKKGDKPISGNAYVELVGY